MNYRNKMAERHVHWLGQGKHALNFQQAGFARAAQEHEQAARDEQCGWRRTEKKTEMQFAR